VFHPKSGRAQVVEEAARPLVPEGGLVPLLVVAHPGVHQHRVPGGADDPGLDARAEVAGDVVPEVRLDPAVVADDPVRVRVRQHLGGGEGGAADLDDARDRHLAEGERVHGSLLA
jgi:hypothetical protein